VNCETNIVGGHDLDDIDLPFSPPEASTSCKIVKVGETASDREGRGGAGSVPAPEDWLRRLREALLHMGTRCTNFFGGQKAIDDRILELSDPNAAGQIKFVEVGGIGYTDVIPGAPPGTPSWTYKSFWLFWQAKGIPEVKILLERGADLTIRNQRGATALAIAQAYTNQGEVIRLLKEAGAKE
jgi:hypothetical protein